MSDRSASWLAEIALLAASLVLVMGALELALRLQAAGRAVPPRSELPPTLADLPRLQGVLSLTRPNVRGTFRGVLHETNSLGLRDHEYAIPKPPGVFRVVVIGDSVTMGSGVAEADTYAARLEETLGPTVEVLNLGLAGLSAEANVRRLERIGTRYEPDLVVYGWTINDLEGAHYRKTTSPRAVRAGALYLEHFLAQRWATLRDLYFPAPDSYLAELEENYFRNGPAWDAFGAALGRIQELSEVRGICAAVFLHTDLHHLRGSRHPMERYYAAVAEAARAAGLEVIPSLSFFRGQDERLLWVDFLDPHPNADGHALLARALLAGLASLPEHCGTSELLADFAPAGPSPRVR